jgi:hypothetical protein
LAAISTVLPLKAPFGVAVKVTGNIVKAATIGVLIGYATRANAGSFVGGAVGLIRGCVRIIKEWPNLTERGC